eukprot:TRINITY_DN27873_c0_g1_i1.p1 TRINITY_DN27873_c0_g1~~TRINITY_DN27873_c0_g1_i1.p1  ORF type:complete len:891 (+),score=262.37 TRINITY_DN27873_c0_g1_i1:82-2673(+)
MAAVMKPRELRDEVIPPGAAISEAEREVMTQAWEALMDGKREVRTVDHLLALMRQCNVQPCGQEDEYMRYMHGGRFTYDDFYAAMCDEKQRFHRFKNCNTAVKMNVDLSDAFAAMGGDAESEVDGYGYANSAKISQLCNEFGLSVDLPGNRMNPEPPRSGGPRYRGPRSGMQSAFAPAQLPVDPDAPEEVPYEKFMEWLSRGGRASLVLAGGAGAPAPGAAAHAALASEVSEVYDDGIGAMTMSGGLQRGVKSMWTLRNSLQLGSQIKAGKRRDELHGANVLDVASGSALHDQIKRREEQCMHLDLGSKIHKKLAHKHHEGTDSAASVDYFIHLCRLLANPENSREHGDNFHYRPRKGSLLYTAGQGNALATQGVPRNLRSGRARRAASAQGGRRKGNKPTLRVRTLRGGLRRFNVKQSPQQSPRDDNKVDYVHPVAETFRRQYARPHTAEESRERLGIQPPPAVDDHAEYQRRALENYHHIVDAPAKTARYVLPFQNQLQMPQRLVQEVLSQQQPPPWQARAPQPPKKVAATPGDPKSPLSVTSTQHSGSKWDMLRPGSGRMGYGPTSPLSPGFARALLTTKGAEGDSSRGAATATPKTSAKQKVIDRDPHRESLESATSALAPGSSLLVPAGKDPGSGKRPITFVPMPHNHDTTNRKVAKFKKDGTLRPGLDKRLFDHYFGFVAPPRHAAEEMAKGAKNSDLAGHGLMEFFPRSGPMLTSVQQEALKLPEADAKANGDSPRRPSPPQTSAPERRPTLSVRQNPAAMVNMMQKHGFAGRTPDAGEGSAVPPPNLVTPAGGISPGARSGGSTPRAVKGAVPPTPRGGLMAPMGVQRSRSTASAAPPQLLPPQNVYQPNRKALR